MLKFLKYELKANMKVFICKFSFVNVINYFKKSVYLSEFRIVVKTQDGSTMTLQFLASMDLQKEAEQISR